MQKSPPRLLEGDLGAIRSLDEEKGQDDWPGCENRRDRASCEKWRKRLFHRKPKPRRAKPMMDRVARKNIARKQRDLPRLDDHDASGKTSQNPVQHGLPFERAREQPEAEHGKGERLDLLDVLNTPDRRTAKSGCQRGHSGARRVPALVLEQHENRKRCQPKKQEAIKIELPETRLGHEISQKERGREDQRLRIGNLRRARKDIVSPEGGLAGVKGIRQKLKLWLEMSFRIIRNRDGARQPRQGEYQPAYGYRAKCRGVTA